MSRIFGEPVHAGFVVTNADEAVNRLLHAGVGPAFFMRGIRVPTRYRGERHDILITAAFLYAGGMQLEFVEQHDATPSAYREFLERHPGGGLHHLAYFCTGFEAAYAQAAAQSVPLEIVQEFITPEGHPYEIYAQALGTADPVLVQLMIPSPLEAFFEQMKAAAATWDGAEPRRDALALLPEAMRPPTESF